MKLLGKVAVVTGASKGIGRSIAVEFAKHGATVVINYNNDRAGAEETQRIINDLSGEACIIQSNVADYNMAEKLITSTVDIYGQIDVLVNNAGISKIGLFTDMTPQDWQQIIGINLTGVFNCTHQAVKQMLPRKSGSIINISSIWGESGGSCEVFYSASKGGVNAFTKALGKELAPSNIRVNAIAPGVIDTAMNQCFSPQDRDAIIQNIPMLRLGQGEDVAKLAVFLASDDSSYITAQVITVDGGML